MSDWYLNALSVVEDGLTEATGYHTYAGLAAAVTLAANDTIWFNTDAAIDDSASDIELPNKALTLRAIDEAVHASWLVNKLTISQAGWYKAIGMRFLDITAAAGILCSSLGLGSEIVGCKFPGVTSIFFIDVRNLKLLSNIFDGCAVRFRASDIGGFIPGTFFPFSICGNVFYNTGGGIALIVDGTNYLRGNNARGSIKGNIFHTCAVAINFSKGLGNNLVEIGRNTFYNCTTTLQGDAVDSDQGDNQVADPQCTNPAGGDFTIGYESPCFNASENETDDSLVATVDHVGASRMVFERPCVGAYEVAAKSHSEVWMLVNAMYVYEAAFGHDITLISTHYTGTRKAWCDAFLTEFTALWTTVQSKINSQVACINSIRGLFSLAPIGAITIAGASHKAKCLSWGNSSDAVGTAVNDCMSVVATIPPGQKTDAANAQISKISAISLELETLAKKYRTNVEFLMTIIV